LRCTWPGVDPEELAGNWRAVGGRDHTTVLHAVRKMAAERQQMTDQPAAACA
jgi:hypothetical protein